MKDIKGYKGLYAITKDGKVWSYGVNSRRKPQGGWMKPQPIGKGYLIVMIKRDGKYKHPLVHRLVAQAYIPNPKRLKEVNHKDGDRTNNIVENLEWVDSTGNKQHAIRLGLYKNLIGENHYKSKLADKDIEEIRRLGKKGNLYQWEIGKIYGVNQSTISSILSGKQRKHN